LRLSLPTSSAAVPTTPFTHRTRPTAAALSITIELTKSTQRHQQLVVKVKQCGEHQDITQPKAFFFEKGEILRHDEVKQAAELWNGAEGRDCVLKSRATISLGKTCAASTTTTGAVVAGAALAVTLEI
jgi:hypothetical protein